MKPNVLFSTNTYSRDWVYLVNGGFDTKYLLCDYPFAEKWIILNGVDDRFDNADMAWDRAMTEKYALQILKIQPDSFKDFTSGTPQDGYIYSIDSLIELAFGQGFDYICHFCGDVELKRKADWVSEGIRWIEQGYFGARPRLPIYTDSPESEQSLIETDTFSDHVYLLPVVNTLSQLPAIFSLTKPSCSPPHPAYGGESFERKMTRYMRATDQKMRIITNAEEVPCSL